MAARLQLMPQMVRMVPQRTYQAAPCRHQAHRARQATCSAAAASDATDATGADEIPGSLEESIAQASGAIETALELDGKRKKKGFALWAGVKRLAVEVPMQDEAGASQIALAKNILAALPGSAGAPVIVFGRQATTDLARDSNIPLEVYSLEEAEEEDIEGPLILVCTERAQGAACERLLDQRWSGRVVVVVNAEWLRDVPLGLDDFADSLNIVYYFLPISFQGIFGGKTGFVFRWTKSRVGASTWRIYLDDKGIQRVGQMATKPTESDIESAVYNASAAKSPLTAGAKFFNKLTAGLRGEDKDKKK